MCFLFHQYHIVWLMVYTHTYIFLAHIYLLNITILLLCLRSNIHSNLYTCSFLLLVIPSWISELPPDFISPLSEKLFRISITASVLELTFLSFPLSENIFVAPSLLKNVFFASSVLCWQLFSYVFCCFCSKISFSLFWSCQINLFLPLL